MPSDAHASLGMMPELDSLGEGRPALSGVHWEGFLHLLHILDLLVEVLDVPVASDALQWPLLFAFFTPFWFFFSFFWLLLSNRLRERERERKRERFCGFEGENASPHESMETVSLPLSPSPSALLTLEEEKGERGDGLVKGDFYTSEKTYEGASVFLTPKN